MPRIAFINKMDRVGSDYFGVVEQIREKLGHNAVSMHVPIGSEDSFTGMVDLLSMKAVIYSDDDNMGSTFKIEDVPADLAEVAAEYREKLVEAAAELDDALMEKYLEGADISPDELKVAIRKGVLEMKLIPVFCGSAFKNKGVQALLDAVVEFMPAPTDVPAITGINPRHRRGRRETIF